MPETHEGLVEYLRTHASMYKAQNMLGDPKAAIRIGEIYDWIIENGVCLTGIDLERTERQPYYGPAKSQGLLLQQYGLSVVQPRARKYWEGWAAGIIPYQPRMECRRNLSNRALHGLNWIICEITPNKWLTSGLLSLESLFENGSSRRLASSLVE